MANQTQRLELATVNAELGSHILFRFANDAVGAALIPTDSGDIKNLKQVVVDIQADGAEKISFATTIYPTTAAGIAATTDGAIFLVKSAAADEVYEVWQNVVGVATDTGKRALTATAITAAMDSAGASAGAAAVFASAAEDSADLAAARVAPFLGTFTTAPTLRNDSSALQIGDRYFNSGDDLEYLYKSTGWEPNNLDGALLAAPGGSGLVGFPLEGGGTADVYSVLAGARRPIELFGAVGDYDPVTQTGTDCTAAFLLAKAAGVPILLGRNKKYLITDTIQAWSGMDIMGDDNYSPAIYCQFPASGKLFFASPLTGGRLKNVCLKGFTIARIGAHAEHGILIDNTDGGFLDLKVISDGTALGGAVGISAFYPYNRPSTNFYAKLNCEKGGNFALQYGNVDEGSMQVFSKDTMREVIGIEPYTLGKYDFATSTADTLTLTAHGLTTGYPLIYSRQNNTAIAGFGRANYYFAIVIDANTIKLAETKEDALAGIAKAIGAFSGTHRLYKCGIARNIEVIPSAIDVGDVPAAGSATGVVILAAASGGYHEGISIRGVDVIERNPTSGSHSFSVYGAQNVSIANCSATGSKANAVMVTSAFLNNVSDATGDISPTGGLELLPDVKIFNVNGREFGGSGVRVNKGKAIVEECILRSGVSGALGISISADSEGSKGARARRNTVSVPNGTPFDFVTGTGNVDENSNTRRDYSAKRINSEFSQISKNLTTTGNVVGTCVSQDGTATNFSGVLFITVKQVDANASETAHYILQVAKGATSLAPQLVTVSSAGLLTGAGGTFPSFTWSIDSSSQLKATPIGLTNPNATWNFFTTTIGDLHVS